MAKSKPTQISDLIGGTKGQAYGGRAVPYIDMFKIGLQQVIDDQAADMEYYTEQLKELQDQKSKLSQMAAEARRKAGIAASDAREFNARQFNSAARAEALAKGTNMRFNARQRGGTRTIPGGTYRGEAAAIEEIYATAGSEVDDVTKRLLTEVEDVVGDAGDVVREFNVQRRVSESPEKATSRMDTQLAYAAIVETAAVRKVRRGDYDNLADAREAAKSELDEGDRVLLNELENKAKADAQKKTRSGKTPTYVREEIEIPYSEISPEEAAQPFLQEAAGYEQALADLSEQERQLLLQRAAARERDPMFEARERFRKSFFPGSTPAYLRNELLRRFRTSTALTPEQKQEIVRKFLEQNIGAQSRARGVPSRLPSNVPRMPGDVLGGPGSPFRIPSGYVEGTDQIPQTAAIQPRLSADMKGTLEDIDYLTRQYRKFSGRRPEEIEALLARGEEVSPEDIPSAAVLEEQERIKTMLDDRIAQGKEYFASKGYDLSQDDNGQWGFKTFFKDASDKIRASEAGDIPKEEAEASLTKAKEYYGKQGYIWQDAGPNAGAARFTLRGAMNDEIAMSLYNDSLAKERELESEASKLLEERNRQIDETGDVDDELMDRVLKAQEELEAIKESNRRRAETLRAFYEDRGLTLTRADGRGRLPESMRNYLDSRGIDYGADDGSLVLTDASGKVIQPGSPEANPIGRDIRDLARDNAFAQFDIETASPEEIELRRQAMRASDLLNRGEARSSDEDLELTALSAQIQDAVSKMPIPKDRNMITPELMDFLQLDEELKSYDMSITGQATPFEIERQEEVIDFLARTGGKEDIPFDLQQKLNRRAAVVGAREEEERLDEESRAFQTPFKSQPTGKYYRLPYEKKYREAEEVVPFFRQGGGRADQKELEDLYGPKKRQEGYLSPMGESMQKGTDFTAEQKDKQAKIQAAQAAVSYIEDGTFDKKLKGAIGSQVYDFWSANKARGKLNTKEMLSYLAQEFPDPSAGREAAEILYGLEYKNIESSKLKPKAKDKA